MARGLRIGHPSGSAYSLTAGQGAIALNGQAATLAYSGAAGGVDGQLGPYLDLDISTYPVYQIDFAEEDTPFYLTSPSTGTWEPTGNVLGGAAARLNPHESSSGGQYCALGQFGLLASQGTFYDFSLSFELKVGALWAANNDGDACKMVILWSGSGPTRPMLYLDSRLSGIGPTDSCFLCPAQGTTRYFSTSHPTNAFFDGDGRADFYFGQSATTYAGKRVLAPSDWVNVDMHCNSRQDDGFANGVIRMVVTARDGDVLSDIAAPWNHDAGASFNQAFNNIDVLGHYLNFATGTYSTENCLRIAGVRVAKNYGGPLGPRTGFLT